MTSTTNPKSAGSTGALGFEATLWAAADKLRGNLDAAEYKHVVLGLIFLKYISDAFEEKHAALAKDKDANPEDRDEYIAENIFWVPPEARWSYLRGRAKDPVIGKLLDNAMIAIERDNTALKGVLPKEYSRPHLDKQSLGGVIDLVSTIGLGDKESRSKDIIGRVYEYFLSEFASAEGKKGGQFYTAPCVVQLLVEMLAPYKGRLFDPCCGSGGMFVQSVKLVKAHASGNGNGGKAKGDVSIFGQESNPTTWRLARMNLAIRGIEANLGLEPADSFHRDLHKDLKADYILANPPFNMSDWGGDRLREDARWKYGVPSTGNANYAWVQHFLYHLTPTGMAGFVLVNGSMSSNQSGEGDIRKAIIEADLVDCMVALPGHLFYSMYSQVCLWFLTRTKTKSVQRERRGETLFIDARDLGVMVERTHRELTSDDIKRVVQTYHSWAHVNPRVPFKNVVGFCRAATIEDIRKKDWSLSPARYVGSEAIGESDESSDLRIAHLTVLLAGRITEAKQRNERLITNLTGLGYAGKFKHSDEDRSGLAGLGAIKVNQRLNATLVDIAKVLFRSWFVDFDPVRAKSENRNDCLPKHISDLFPSDFEDSELGEIPRGWRVAKYSEILRPISARIGDIEAPEYSATVRGLELRDARFNKQLSKAQTKNKQIQKNQLVFGLSRKVLNFGLMTEEIGSVSPVYEIFQIDSSKYVPELLELYIRYHMKMHIDILKPGAREGQAIDRDYLLCKEVLTPDFKVQSMFESILRGDPFENAK